MDKTYGTISIFESCPSTRTRGLKFPRPRWIINRHHVDDARANIEFPGAPSIVRLDKCSLPSIQMRTRHENLCNFSLKCFPRPMTNHPDSNSELVRTFSTILRPNSYDLRRNTSYFDQFIITSICLENRSMRACHCNCAYSLSLSGGKSGRSKN